MPTLPAIAGQPSFWRGRHPQRRFHLHGLSQFFFGPLETYVSVRFIDDGRVTFGAHPRLTDAKGTALAAPSCTLLEARFSNGRTEHALIALNDEGEFSEGRLECHLEADGHRYAGTLVLTTPNLKRDSLGLRQRNYVIAWRLARTLREQADTPWAHTFAAQFGGAVEHLRARQLKEALRRSFENDQLAASGALRKALPPRPHKPGIHAP